MSNGKLRSIVYYAGLYSRLFKKMLGTHVAYEFLDGFSPYLNLVTFDLTWRCNLRCIMCQFYGQSGAKKKFTQSSLREQEMGLDEWKRVVDDIVPFTPTIHLFGGEPLLYEEAIELIKYIKSKKLRCQIVTNGTLVKDKSEGIVKSGLDEIWISIDGPEEIHNKIRRANSFRKILDGISSINDLKTKMNVRKPVVRIICTVFDVNYLYLNELARYLESFNIYSILFSYVRFIDKDLVIKHDAVIQREFQTESHAWEGYVLDVNKMDVNRLIDEVNRLKTKRYPFRVDFEPDFSPSEINKYYTNVKTSLRKKCIVPWLTAVITPDGNVSPCPDFFVGNVRTARFQDIWNGEKCLQFRSRLKKMKKLPACNRCPSIHGYAFKKLFKEIFHGIKDSVRN